MIFINYRERDMKNNNLAIPTRTEFFNALMETDDYVNSPQIQELLRDDVVVILDSLFIPKIRLQDLVDTAIVPHRLLVMCYDVLDLPHLTQSVKDRVHQIALICTAMCEKLYKRPQDAHILKVFLMSGMHARMSDIFGG